MIRLAVLLGLFLGLPAAAAPNAIPGLYSVTDVAEADVLNLRATPDADAEILGGLAPDARDVEVVRVSPNGDWGLVNLDAATGWVKFDFLRPMPGEWQGRFPSPASCFGTEPFWSLDVTETETVLKRAGERTLTFPAGDRKTAAGRSDRFSIATSMDKRSLTTVIGAQACSDGMSDRQYGMTSDIILFNGASHTHLTGCCSLAP